MSDPLRSGVSRLARLVTGVAGIVLLAACTPDHFVVYRCEGTATTVTAVYTEENGVTVSENVTLPWEEIVTLEGSNVPFGLEVDNLGDTGAIACVVVVDAEHRLAASGELKVLIEGSVVRQGGQDLLNATSSHVDR